MVVLNPGVQLTGDLQESVRKQARALCREADARRWQLTGGRPMPAIEGKTVILVDDGIATGSTIAAAAKFVRSARPALLVVAVPVAPPDAIDFLAGYADDVVCLLQPDFFAAVGQFYESFPQVQDAKVRKLLVQAEKIGAG